MAEENKEEDEDVIKKVEEFTLREIEKALLGKDYLKFLR